MSDEPKKPIDQLAATVGDDPKAAERLMDHLKKQQRVEQHRAEREAHSREHPEVMDVYQAADFLQISTVTMYRLLKAGKIPARKIGREWRFGKAALEEWAAGTDKGGTDMHGQNEASVKVDFYQHAPADDYENVGGTVAVSYRPGEVAPGSLAAFVHDGKVHVGHDHAELMAAGFQVRVLGEAVTLAFKVQGGKVFMPDSIKRECLGGTEARG